MFGEHPTCYQMLNLVVDSQDGIPISADYPTSHFKIRMPEALDHVQSVELLSAELPETDYNVSLVNNKVCLLASTTQIVRPSTIRFAEGGAGQLADVPCDAANMPHFPVRYGGGDKGDPAAQYESWAPAKGEAGSENFHYYEENTWLPKHYGDNWYIGATPPNTSDYIDVSNKPVKYHASGAPDLVGYPGVWYNPDTAVYVTGSMNAGTNGINVSNCLIPRVELVKRNILNVEMQPGCYQAAGDITVEEQQTHFPSLLESTMNTQWADKTRHSRIGDSFSTPEGDAYWDATSPWSVVYDPLTWRHTISADASYAASQNISRSAGGQSVVKTADIDAIPNDAALMMSSGGGGAIYADGSTLYHEDSLYIPQMLKKQQILGFEFSYKTITTSDTASPAYIAPVDRNTSMLRIIGITSKQILGPFDLPGIGSIDGGGTKTLPTYPSSILCTASVDLRGDDVCVMDLRLGDVQRYQTSSASGSTSYENVFALVPLRSGPKLNTDIGDRVAFHRTTFPSKISFNEIEVAIRRKRYEEYPAHLQYYDMQNLNFSLKLGIRRCVKLL